MGRALVEAKNSPSTLLQALSCMALVKKVEQVEANWPQNFTQGGGMQIKSIIRC